MPNSDRKIVWILGAGFSRSLGAPLLANLFSQESPDHVTLAYRGIGQVDSWLGSAQAVTDLYLNGVHGLDHIKPRERHWEHAEEFLAGCGKTLLSKPFGDSHRCETVS